MKLGGNMWQKHAKTQYFNWRFHLSASPWWEVSSQLEQNSMLVLLRDAFRTIMSPSCLKLQIPKVHRFSIDFELCPGLSISHGRNGILPAPHGTEILTSSSCPLRVQHYGKLMKVGRFLSGLAFLSFSFATKVRLKHGCFVLLLLRFH